MLATKMRSLMILKSGPLFSLSKVVRSLRNCREPSGTWKTPSSSSEPQVSIGANYIEANDSIGKKDFLMKVKICRREAKESGYWLHLLDVDGKLEPERQRLAAEAAELMKIFGAIVRKCE